MPTKKEHHVKSSDAAQSPPEPDADLVALAEVARQLGGSWATRATRQRSTMSSPGRFRRVDCEAVGT
jgi:hypothetical protein